MKDLDYLRFLLAVVCMVWPIVSHGAELPSTLTLPSDRQCRTLLNQGGEEKQSTIKAEIAGWCLIIMVSKGNCLACHDIDVTTWPEGLSAPGNTAPMLTNRANRLADKTALRNIIYNAASQNPHTFMPLFGKHKILTEPEIDRIVTFLMTL